MIGHWGFCWDFLREYSVEKICFEGSKVNEINGYRHDENC
jgi:hypothetical protein